MITCSDSFKSKIGGNIRYLKAFLVHGSEETEIKTFSLKTGGMGSERFGFGTCYIHQAEITVNDQISLSKGEIIQIRLYASDKSYSDTTGVDNCVIARFYAYSCTKSGGVCTVVGYGYLFQNDQSVPWDSEDGTVTIEEMNTKIKDITGMDVVLKGFTDSQKQQALNMTVKRIMEQPTVKAYLCQMAESLMGYAYESVNGEFVICHGVAAKDTTGMEANILQHLVNEDLTVGNLTCVISEGYTEDDGTYIDPVFIIEEGTGSNAIKYRGYTTSQSQFDVLKTDIMSIKYAPGAVNMFGNPLIEPSDGISFVDGNGDTQFIICAGEITQTFDGGLQTNIVAPDGVTDADQQTIDGGYEADETQYQKELKVRELYAITAKIGSWELGDGYIRDLDKNGHYTGMGQEGIAQAFFAGGIEADGSDGVFRVGHDGHLYASSATISGIIKATSLNVEQVIYSEFADIYGVADAKTNYVQTITTDNPTGAESTEGYSFFGMLVDSEGLSGTGCVISAGMIIQNSTDRVSAGYLAADMLLYATGTLTLSTLAGITLDGAVSISGKLNVSDMVVVKHSDLGFRHTHTTTGNSVKFGVGAGGVNRGVFDSTNEQWMIYKNGDGNVGIGPTIDGNNIIYKPYFGKGDSFSVTLRTAGYVTNSGKDVTFYLFTDKPIIGKPTVTVTSVDGFILRQGGKYTHGSSSTTYVIPDSYSTAANDICGVSIVARFSSNADCTNNDAIGILWTGTITFS